jgi:hypothetical protein
MGGALHDSGLRSVEWFTPPHIFDALGLTFDLDPCAPAGGVPWIPAAAHYSTEDDGLSRRWEGRVWLNPPYGREAAEWVDRLVAHGDGVALVFVRSDAVWAQRAIKTATAVCLIAGRLRFVDGTTRMNDRSRKVQCAANGSMLLAYGDECAAALIDSGLGVCFRPLGDPVS